MEFSYERERARLRFKETSLVNSSKEVESDAIESPQRGVQPENNTFHKSWKNNNLRKLGNQEKEN